MNGLISEQDKHDLTLLAGGQTGVAGNFVEIGSLEGMSALSILAGMPADRKLWCFDFFEPEKYTAFCINVEVAVATSVIAMAGDFRDTLPRSLPDIGPIAFAFVDHDHSLLSTVAAYDLLDPHLSPGALLAFHDYDHADYREPKAFLDAIAYTKVLCRPGLIVFQKPTL